MYRLPESSGTIWTGKLLRIWWEFSRNCSWKLKELKCCTCFMNEVKAFRLCTSCWKYFRANFSLCPFEPPFVCNQKNKIPHKNFSVGDCNGVGMLLFPQKLFSAANSMAQRFFASTYFLLTKLFFYSRPVNFIYL